MKMDLRKMMLPHLTRIRDRFREAVGMAIVDEVTCDGLILASVPPLERFGFMLTEGCRFPIHTGAPTKAMAAFLPEERQRALLAKLTYKRFTATTLTSRKAFTAELSKIRACGYALDRAEEVEGCYCIAVPLFAPNGEPLAGIWYTGPSSRLSIAQLEATYPELRALVDHAQHDLHTFIKTSSGKAIQAEKMALARQRLEEPPFNTSYDMPTLARSLGMSYSMFRHLFKAHFDISPSQYRLNSRIAEAQRLLRNNKQPIARIAEETGFQTLTHFSVIFKAKTGTSPSAYRALAVAEREQTRE
jgi:DNA-binding IclR family transcriptional regulator/AraC-like DNA-binding protein